MDVNPLTFPSQNKSWHLSVSICFTSCSCDLISAANKPSSAICILHAVVRLTASMLHVETKCQLIFCVCMLLHRKLYIYTWQMPACNVISRGLNVLTSLFRHCRVCLSVLYSTPIKTTVRKTCFYPNRKQSRGPIFTKCVSVVVECRHHNFPWSVYLMFYEQDFLQNLRGLDKTAGLATWD